MAFKKRRLIQAISDRAPSDDKSLLAAVQREVWPFLKQIRRLLNDNGEGNGPGGGGTGSPFDDHLVIEHDLDTIPGTLEGKTTNRANLVRNRVTEGGIDKLEFGVVISTETPLGPVSGGDPGPTGPDVKPSGEGHRHPLQDMPNPTVTGSTLWTGAKRPVTEAKAPLQRGEGIGFGSVFVPAGPAFAWVKTGAEGPLLGRDSSGSNTIVFHDGDIAFAWTPDSGSVEKQYFGPYLVLDCGLHVVDGHSVATHPVIQRLPSTMTPAGLTGTIVRITGVGAEHGGDYAHEDATIAGVDSTDTAWSFSSTGPTTNLDVLFSMALAQKLDLDPTTLFAVQNTASPDGLPTYISMGPICEVAVADLGVDRIPAGLQTFAVRNARVSSGYNPTTNPGDTWLAMLIRKRTADGGTVTAISSSDNWPRSLPLTGAGGSVAPFAWMLGADATFSPGDVLQLMPMLVTTCLQAVEVTLEWNNQARDAIAWATTMTFPATGGTNDHPDLINRDKADQHPRYAITDAIGTATIDGSGTGTRLHLAAPYRSGEVSISTSTVLYGVDPTGWTDGQEMTVFVDGCSLTNHFTLTNMGASGDGSDIWCRTHPGTTAGQNVELSAPAVIVLKRRVRLNRWQLMNYFS